VTESQAYALLITGTILASWEEHARKIPGADRGEVLTAFEGYYNFWKKMCQNTVGNSACQNDGDYCFDPDANTKSYCLPDWKQKSDGSGSKWTGPAPDGDEDAIVGIILAVKAVKNDSTRPAWYDEARKWADASATAFFTFNVLDSRNGSPTEHRLLKLGACWGGWDWNGNNPSYHSPGSYKVMRDFQKDFPSADRSGYSMIPEDEWNKLISTSHELLLAVQCYGDGALVPNWATIGIGTDGKVEHTNEAFSNGNTPQNEYGAEASRATFRVALDAAFYPQDANDWAEYLDPFLVRLRDGYTGGDRYWDKNKGTFPDCSGESNHNVDIFDSWLYNAFIYAPTMSALIAGAPEDGPLVDAAGSFLAEPLPDKYFERCWALFGNLMLSGAMESAGKTLQV
jgi:hypothetical protein